MRRVLVLSFLLLLGVVGSANAAIDGVYRGKFGAPFPSLNTATLAIQSYSGNRLRLFFEYDANEGLVVGSADYKAIYNPVTRKFTAILIRIEGNHPNLRWVNFTGTVSADGKRITGVPLCGGSNCGTYSVTKWPAPAP